VAGPCSKTVSVIYLPRCCKNSVWRSVKIPCLVGDIKGQHGEIGRRREEQPIGGTFTLTQLSQVGAIISTNNEHRHVGPSTTQHPSRCMADIPDQDARCTTTRTVLMTHDMLLEDQSTGS
jgi:hypothetical protein